MPFDNVAKNDMLAAISPLAVLVSLHTADPGTGALNETTAAREIPTWATPAGGDLALAAALEFTGGASNGPVTWFAVWKTGGTTRIGKGQITSGDVTFNAAGEYTLTTASRLRLTDA